MEKKKVEMTETQKGKIKDLCLELTNRLREYAHGLSGSPYPLLAELDIDPRSLLLNAFATVAGEFIVELSKITIEARMVLKDDKLSFPNEPIEIYDTSLVKYRDEFFLDQMRGTAALELIERARKGERVGMVQELDIEGEENLKETLRKKD